MNRDVWSYVCPDFDDDELGIDPEEEQEEEDEEEREEGDEPDDERDRR